MKSKTLSKVFISFLIAFSVFAFNSCSQAKALKNVVWELTSASAPGSHVYFYFTDNAMYQISSTNGVYNKDRYHECKIGNKKITSKGIPGGYVTYTIKKDVLTFTDVDGGNMVFNKVTDGTVIEKVKEVINQ